VLRQADVGILELLAVPGEEDGSGPRTIANPEDVAFGEGWTVRLRCERVVVRLEAVCGKVADRVAVPACAGLLFDDKVSP